MDAAAKNPGQKMSPVFLWRQFADGVRMNDSYLDGLPHIRKNC